MTVHELARLQRRAASRAHAEAVEATLEALLAHTPHHMLTLEYEVERPNRATVRVRGKRALQIETVVRVEDVEPGE